MGWGHGGETRVGRDRLRLLRAEHLVETVEGCQAKTEPGWLGAGRHGRAGWCCEEFNPIGDGDWEKGKVNCELETANCKQVHKFTGSIQPMRLRFRLSASLGSAGTHANNPGLDAGLQQQEILAPEIMPPKAVRILLAPLGQTVWA